MPLFSRKKHHSSANRLASQSAQQPPLVCTWSAHTPQSGASPSPFPRDCYTLTATATATAAGEFFLFGGYVGHADPRASSDLYVFSTRDFSTTLLQTSGEVPTPRARHGAALIGTTFVICGGFMDLNIQSILNHDSLHLLDLVSREWSRVVFNGPGPGARCHPSTIVVGSKLFVFGGEIDGKNFNDMWTLDLNCLKSQPVWESYEPTPGNEKPLPRTAHVSVTTEDRIIVFGGYRDYDRHRYNDTWSFDISTRKWTELQCTGSIPSPRSDHDTVLVDDVMYVFGGFSGKTRLDDLHALQLSTQRWFQLHNVGPSPHARWGHAMASDGTRVFVLGGYSENAPKDEISLIYVFDTKNIKYPEPEPNAINPNEKTQLSGKSSTRPPIQEQPQHLKSSSLEAHGDSRLQNVTPAVSHPPASPQITHERNTGPNGRPLELTGVSSKPRRIPEDDVSERSTEDHAKLATPHPSSEEVTRLKLEPQPSVSPAALTERDKRIVRLTDELALKSALLEQAEANAVEAGRRAGLELRERLLKQTSLVEQRDAELVEMQARLSDMQARLEKWQLSRDQQIGQYEKELTNVRAKLEAKESELDTVQLRLTDAKSLSESKTEADTLRAQTATGSVNRDEDQVTRRLMERMRAIETELEVASQRWNEKHIEDMECTNEKRIEDMERRNEG